MSKDKRLQVGRCFLSHHEDTREVNRQEIFEKKQMVSLDDIHVEIQEDNQQGFYEELIEGDPQNHVRNANNKLELEFEKFARM